jgi:hypothetical protein
VITLDTYTKSLGIKIKEGISSGNVSVCANWGKGQNSCGVGTPYEETLTEKNYLIPNTTLFTVVPSPCKNKASLNYYNKVNTIIVNNNDSVQHNFSLYLVDSLTENIIISNFTLNPNEIFRLDCCGQNVYNADGTSKIPASYLTPLLGYTTGGNVNYNVTLSQIANYSTVQKVDLVFNVTCAANATVNFNGIGNLQLKRFNNQNVKAGDIIANGIYSGYINGSNFVILSVTNLIVTA